LQVAVEKKKKNILNSRSDVAVLAQGLGPEAKLKVFRRAESINLSEKHQTGGTGTDTRSAMMKTTTAHNKKFSQTTPSSRVVIPKTERRRPRYCGGLTVCVETKTGSDFNIGDIARAAASKELQSTQAKWQLIGRFHAKWFQSDPNKHNFSYASLQHALTSTSAGNPDAMRITREQFISTTMVI
jgi:hypothetical protein